MHELLMPGSEKKHLLLGNEAIVRGALEGNVRFVAAYPGTPSSEIIDRFHRIGSDAGVYVEYSVNEKVSVEMAGAAAVSGVRSLCAMKHVGLNVAADAFMTLAYVGVKAGMVVVVADDPSLHSSQNEQDNRYYAKLGNVPMFEPSTPEEAKAMTLEALAVSEKYHIPVMLRTTTRVNHCRGPVTLGEIPSGTPRGEFKKDPFNLVVVPMVGRKLRLALLDKLALLQEEAERSALNFSTGKGKWGIVTSGVSYLYVLDAVRDLGLRDRVKVLKLGFTFPHPKALIRDFMRGLGKVLVVEELEPFLEEAVRVTAQEFGLRVAIAGKGAELTPRAFELDGVKVKRAMSSFFGLNYQPPRVFTAPALPQRPPNLCPGCPHRATYVSVRKVFGDDAIYPTDIGCYTLGILPPLRMADFLICMGSGVSTAGGFSKVQDKPVVAFIGDSTFFHSGITGLINGVSHDHRFLLVVLDNGTTAMTGHQPHPGIELTPAGKIEPRVSLENVIRGCGVKRLEVVNPLRMEKTREVLEDMRRTLKEPGVSVLISKSPCPLFENRMLRKRQKVVFQVDASCDLCKRCLEELGCPAFAWEPGASGEMCVRINEALCSGCSVCSQLCKSIKPKRIEESRGGSE
ncbi:indolepyruvate ferredoxin oxidoreductase subunit alpha [Syntrophobacter fumaroxidans]|uniref:Indolepyruvate oxidoreductase subunit IorA n=1 Tax=Syntrophobacter fumaroxidans (strain DSM 10017 / MPOB) TaxID=335543 RepID=A0LQN8_SYNFM|nr:indolepyruvate ferredoxin oxidoreductase subunit alpha [Syntrophobacter fumaroxidans]ABK19740.1 indolepyruvate ferredoxin oxidoreductase, subunit iorA [Syntrophobacter fumaroxidans MPOB]